MRSNPKRSIKMGVVKKTVFVLIAACMLLRSSLATGNEGVSLTGAFESFVCAAVCGTCCGSNIFLLEKNDGFRVTVGNSDLELSQYLDDGKHYKVSGYFYEGTGSCDAGTCIYFHVETVREMVSEEAVFQYNYSVSVGTTVSFKVNLNREDPLGNRYYAFYIRSGYGTPLYDEQQWQQIQPMSTSNTCDYDFDTAGHYVVICHVKETENAESFESVGFSIKVE